jgi:two-component system OmpR family sensor kinase
VTLKSKLTLAVAVVLLVATTLLAVAVVRGVQSSAVQQIDQQLLDIASRPISGAGAPPGVSPRPPDQDGAESSDASEDEVEARYRLIAEAYYDVDGTLVATTHAGFTDDPEPLPSLPETAPPGSLPTNPVTVPAVDGSLEYRVLAVEEAEGTRVIAISLANVQTTMDDLVRLVLFAGGVVVLGASLVSWVIIRRSLQPIDNMIDTAGVIAAGDLSQRIDHPEDGTEIGRLAKALDDMLAQLDTAFAEREASEEQLRRFAADASHELRTPVAAIRGYAELYQQGGIPPGKSLDRAIARIGSESTRMGRLVEDLLLLARLDQQQPLEWSQVDLSVLVRDAAADVRALDPDRSVTAEASGPVVVRGDERRLRQVVTNLVTNARTHTPEGTPIHLRARLDTASAEAVLEVADEGPGIDPEIRTRVFDRFFRGDKSRKVGTGGSGLGLSIVAGVVSAHGGGVDIADFDPHGASFVVRLPLWSGDRNAT